MIWPNGRPRRYQTCYNKANGVVRGGRTTGRLGRRTGRGSRGGGSTRFGEGDADEESSEQGHSEVLIEEISMGTCEGDGVEREWVCDSGADYRMSGDATLFDSLQSIPSKFYVKQIMGRVAVTQWGTVRLLIDEVNGSKKKPGLQEVMFMSGMKVNIFSLQRIRSLGLATIPSSGNLSQIG